MRKKLDTRFPAPRIKKIMQADEDVGKIALAVPVLVSKALEMFLQDLCDRTYNITVQKGVKTVSSSHLKQCVQGYEVYDFLKNVVSKVPDLGAPDASADDKLGKRRKHAEDESEEESKRTRNEAASQTSNGRGRGRGRWRGRRGGGGRVADREIENHESGQSQFSKPGHLKVEIGDGFSDTVDTKETTPVSNARASLRDIDLNIDLTEYEEDTVVEQLQPSEAPVMAVAAAPAGPSVSQVREEVKTKDFLSWQLPEMSKMAMDPVQFALSSNHRLEEEDEDYDNEE
uniref:Uncharacterized protein n=1 Tax=Avena sativa TaxID=4498 RepID=A0ACD5T925_AVESA